MPGHVITIMGGKGGVGKTQFSANFAFAMAEQMRSKSLLLDFDQRAAGDLNLVTGLKPKKNLKEVSEFNGAIEARSMQALVTPHPANVHYIGMPSDPMLAEGVNVDSMGKFLKGCTNVYQTIVVDGGSEVTPLAAKALEASTLIFLVVTPDILALNQTHKMYNDLIGMLFPKDMIQIIVNQYQKGLPVSLEVVGKTFGKAVFGVIPKDDATCVAALSSKKVAYASSQRTAFAKGVKDCCNKIVQKSVLKSLARLLKPSEVSSQKSAGKPGKDGNSPWINLKIRINAQMVPLLKFGEVDESDPKALQLMKQQAQKVIAQILEKEDTKGVLNSREDRNQLVKEIIDEALGLGPLEDLLSDKACSEIMVIGPQKIYYEHSGKLKKSKVTFTGDEQVQKVIERIVSPVGRRIDTKTPYVDARLSDGSRVHAIIPPCALDGGTITIRKFPENRLGVKDLVAFNSMTQAMGDFLKIAVEGKRNIVISGGTGSGKTTLINVLAGFIPVDERIITCEDSAELDLPQDHVVRLETRPPSLEGEHEVDIRLLVKQTLRMRPDRIIVGECRGGETLDMLQAMGTGHEGSMTTIHSNNPRECVGRIETLVQYAGAGISNKAISEMIANSVHMIVQQSRLDDGSRKVTYVSEITGLQGDKITIQDIYTFQQTDFAGGKVVGEFVASGLMPNFIEKLEKKGINIPRGLFTNRPTQTKPQASAQAKPKTVAPGAKPPVKKKG